MADWTTQDNWDILPNINVQTKFKDGVAQWFELYPADGYVLHIPSGDEPIYDFSGNNIIGTQPYYTYGGAIAFLTYDFSTNPENYHAHLYEEGMTVYGDVQPPHEIA